MHSIVLKGVGSALLLLAAIILGLGISEFVVRRFFPIYDPSGQLRLAWLADGTPIGPFDHIFRQVKNTGDYDVEVRFNSLGFRDDKPVSLAREDDLFVVGDSFAFGWGVEA